MSSIWLDLENKTTEFLELGLDKVINFEKFNRIAIVHHSSAIEGSSLTYEETALLIDEDITSKGKPMNDHLMVNDHYKALLFTLQKAAEKNSIEPEFLKQINSIVNQNSGKIYNTDLGIYDVTKGNFPLGNVTAGTTSLINHDKVVGMVEELCAKLDKKLNVLSDL